LVVGPGGVPGIFGAVDRPADVANAHRRTVPVGHHHIVPGIGGEDLIVVVDGEIAPRLVDAAHRAVDRRRGDHRRHVLKPDAERGQLGRIDLDTDRRLLLPTDGHLSDAGDLRYLLAENVLGVIVDGGERQHVGAHGEDQDRRIRRVDLAIGRRVRQVLRQLSAGGVDRRLDVLRRRVDVAAELELHGDRSAAEGARRGHLRHAGNLRELPLEGRRDRGRHRLRAGAGELRGDLDGREIDLGQRRHRQQRIGGGADQQDARHHQRGGDRARDEGGRDVHDPVLAAFPAPLPAAVTSRASTRAPGCSRYCPAVTTR
jgi:hypothetical protein